MCASILLGVHGFSSQQHMGKVSIMHNTKHFPTSCSVSPNSQVNIEVFDIPIYFIVIIIDWKTTTLILEQYVYNLTLFICMTIQPLLPASFPVGVTNS